MRTRLFEAFDVVVNATPLGTRGELETETPVTAEQLRGVRLAYDLVYNPLETQFMREARQAGCETVGGLEMLIAQAVEQFRLWTGKEPDVESMRDGRKARAQQFRAVNGWSRIKVTLMASNSNSQERYSRQILFSGIGTEGQAKLLNSRAVIIGCGALGSSQAEALARAGVGKLRIVDRDFVESSNLQRQTMFTEHDAAERLPKAVAAANHIADINSDIDS